MSPRLRGVTTAPTVSYFYDYDSTYGTAADGMLVRVNVGTDYQERYTFDSSFQVASAIRTIGSRTYATSYSRNQVSQATQLTYPSSRAINISHDSIGRLSAISEQPGNGPIWLASVTYNNIGQMTADALGNGVTEQYGYDANRMQLTSQKAGTASPYTNRMNLTYGYSATSGQMGSGSTAGNAGQLMAINNNSTINGTTESAAYTYDNLGRLVTSNQTSNGSSAQRRFAYDRWGNRTGVWDATSGGNQIQSISLQGSGGIPTNQIASVTAGSTVNYTYDAAGNVTNDGVHTYTYDSANRVVSVDSGTTASYAFDHQNRRYKKAIGSTVTHYIWQGSQVLAQHNGSTGAVLTDYVYSGSRMIAKVASGTTSYLLNDRLSARLTLNASGAVVGRQAHLAFGEDFAESGTQEKDHFTTYERDGETGLDYAINRGYSPNLGRFQQADPYRSSGYLVDPQSWNRYSYARNEPINRQDILGLEDSPAGWGWDDLVKYMEFLKAGGLKTTMEVNSSNGSFSDLGGPMQIVLQPPDEQDPPYPGIIPTITIPPPPPPHLDNVADVVKHWPAIRDWIASKGKCGEKLGAVIGFIDYLMSRPNSTIFFYDMRDPGVGGMILGPPGRQTTPNAYFLAHPTNIAFTLNEWIDDINRSFVRADIVFREDFFTDPRVNQAETVFHELLHVGFQADDPGLGLALGMPHGDINAWIDSGCPP